jgi:hypothetical protein
MTPAPNLVPVPQPAPDATPARPHLSTLGLSDGLGDRVLMFDNSTAASLELLRIKREFTDTSGFESAMRTRVDDFSRLRHPSVGTVRNVERLHEGEGLALVMNHVAGRRLSEILGDARGPAFAIELIRQLGPALAALQQHAPGLSHGALTVDRIIVTREGRLIIVEHVLGSAIESMAFSPSRLRSEIGLAVAPGQESPKLDARSDVVQLGFIALALLLGRRLDPADYPANIPTLIGEFARTDAEAAARLRPWLERALQIGSRSFANAQAANEAFMEVAEPGETPAPVEAKGPVLAFQRPTDSSSTSASDAARADMDSPAPLLVDEPKGFSQKRSGKSLILRWAAAALGLLAIGEGLVIAGLFSTRPETTPTVVVKPAGLGLVADNAAASAASNDALSLPAAAQAPVPAATKPAEPAAVPADRATPAANGFGGLRVTSPIDLQVFENGALVGSTSAQIAMSEGAHTLELVNEALGFRARQNVVVKPGQMAALNVGVPNGKVSINAVPWANVWIDGNAAGETPLANLSLAIGQHEVVFRHPQFGEQKQTIIVKVEGLTRVSAAMQGNGEGR